MVRLDTRLLHPQSSILISVPYHCCWIQRVLRAGPPQAFGAYGYVLYSDAGLDRADPQVKPGHYERDVVCRPNRPKPKELVAKEADAKLTMSGVWRCGSSVPPVSLGYGLRRTPLAPLATGLAFSSVDFWRRRRDLTLLAFA